MPARRTSPRSAEGPTWRDAAPAPVVLLQGSEEYFAAQARRRIIAGVRQQRGEAEIHELSAASYTTGALMMATSPSLFGDSRVVVVRELEKMNEEFQQDALCYLKAPDADSVVILIHGGGARGKKVLDAVRAGRHPVVDCKPLKSDRDKTDFLYFTVREAGKRIEPDAARLLIAAAGREVSELSAAARQLVEDGPATITDAVVEKYYGGRMEVTAFKVADAAVSGNSAAALRALRQALDTGVDPVPLVGALAARMRSIAQVHDRRENPTHAAKAWGMAPWQAEQAQRDARRFSAESLGTAIRALAEADAQVKGEAQDPVYSLERAVLAISAAGRR